MKPMAFDLNADLQVGQLLGTVGSGGRVMYAGMLSVGSREVVNNDRGYLGLEFSTSNLVVGNIIEGKPADIAGLLEGDQVLKLGSNVVDNRVSFYSFQKSSKPGQKVILTGRVKSFYEREIAQLAAWRAKGVTKVVDHIEVGQ